MPSLRDGEGIFSTVKTKFRLGGKAIFNNSHNRAKPYRLFFALLWELLFPFFALYLHLSVEERWQMLAGEFIFLVLFVVFWGFHPYLLAGALILDALLTVVFMHIVIIWGVEGLISRFHVFFESSSNVKQEYFQQFIISQPSTYILLFYLGGLLFLLISGLKQRKSFSISLRMQELLLIVLLIALFSLQKFSVPVFHPSIEVIQRSITAYNDIRDIKERATWLQEHPLPPQNCSSPFDKIIVIIGESANRDFLQIYGYPLPTTPFFQRFEQQGTFLKFRAIAPANLTRAALPLILTQATVQNPKDFLHMHNMVSQIRACGYQTFWFSNKETPGKFTLTYTMGTEADFLAFTTDPLGNHTAPPFDERLLEFLKPEIFAPPGTKQAFFFHLNGSHFMYEERHPPEIALFEHPSNLLEAYVNTIYYTDTVIQRIAQTIAPYSQNLLLVYLSDHGELVTPSHSGHAFSNAYQDEFRIPFVLWSSQADQPLLLSIQNQALEKCGFLNSESLPSIMDFLLGKSDALPPLSTDTTGLQLGLYPANYLTLPAAQHREEIGNQSILYGNPCNP